MVDGQVNRDRWAIAGLAAGGTLLLAGGGLAVSQHISSLAHSYRSLCGASDGLSVLAAMTADAGHCWGCPTALAGGMALLAALTLAILRSEGHAASAAMACAGAH